jgi:hypothetical protein
MYTINKNGKEQRLLTRCCRSPLLLAPEPRMPCSLPKSLESSCLGRMPQMGHAKAVCPRPRLACCADGHVPIKRDAFNGRVMCGVSRGQGSCGVFVLLLERSFGITVMVMGWAGLIDCEVTSWLRYSCVLGLYPDGN